MLLLLTQPKLPLPYRTYYRTYHIYRLIIIILRMTKFPPKYFNMKNVNLTLHISSRRGKTVCRQSPSERVNVSEFRSHFGAISPKCPNSDQKSDFRSGWELC